MTFFSQFLRNIDVVSLQQRASKNLNRCQFPECSKFSLGFRCSECNTFACNDHVYFKLTPSPVPVCVSCVLGKYGPGENDAD